MMNFFAPVARAVTISTAIPGSNINSTSSSPGAFVANFYQFALLIAGILAVGVIAYGGIRYMASPGNPSGQSEAKEWIMGALLGLLLLACAYLILNVVNPQLVNLNLPTLNAVTVSNTTGGTQGSGSGGCTGQICTGTGASNSLPQGTISQGTSPCPSSNACGADNGACAGDCSSSGQICAASGPNVTASNVSPAGSTLPWRCIANTSFTQ